MESEKRICNKDILIIDNNVNEKTNYTFIEMKEEPKKHTEMINLQISAVDVLEEQISEELYGEAHITNDIDNTTQGFTQTKQIDIQKRTNVYNNVTTRGDRAVDDVIIVERNFELKNVTDEV